MYEELVERFLLEITEFSGNINDLDVYQLADKDEQDLDDTTNDFDKLENLVDTDDYLMMRAFESYLKPAEDNAFPKQHHTLYQRFDFIKVLILYSTTTVEIFFGHLEIGF